ncbi:hypothetical protein ANN_03246 [Periplaneta americana]|uniref:Uncharacterized protein n=1 Tax=Periplaneta americana TaxID=6978 RepID=A0ABQ8U2G5_PERAM|nr:hypothetical protein ANN_03246 [Periplaneta americana]
MPKYERCTKYNKEWKKRPWAKDNCNLIKIIYSSLKIRSFIASGHRFKTKQDEYRGFIFTPARVTTNYGDPTGQLISVTPDALPVHQGWIEKLSRGDLLKPSDEWLCTVKQFEVVFVGVHGDKLNCCNVIKGMCNILAQKFPHVHPLIIKIYTRTRTFIRIRSLNTAAKTARAAELQRKKARMVNGTRARGKRYQLIDSIKVEDLAENSSFAGFKFRLGRWRGLCEENGGMYA